MFRICYNKNILLASHISTSKISLSSLAPLSVSSQMSSSIVSITGLNIAHEASSKTWERECLSELKIENFAKPKSNTRWRRFEVRLLDTIFNLLTFSTRKFWDGKNYDDMNRKTVRFFFFPIVSVILPTIHYGKLPPCDDKTQTRSRTKNFSQRHSSCLAKHKFRF